MKSFTVASVAVLLIAACTGAQAARCVITWGPFLHGNSPFPSPHYTKIKLFLNVVSFVCNAEADAGPSRRLRAGRALSCTGMIAAYHCA